jgi:heme exporter protein A
VKAALRLHDLACRRGGRILFEGLSLSLAEGGAVVVTGPNGIGKSSLLRLVAGLLEPAAGCVEREGRLALADEMLALDRQRPLSSALGFWAHIDGVPFSAVGDALHRMGIEHLAEVPVRMLSTGQRKRATIARVIASGAAIWLFDEPANGLDTASVERLELVMAHHRASGGIVLATSHQPLALEGAQRLELGRAR